MRRAASSGLAAACIASLRGHARARSSSRPRLPGSFRSREPARPLHGVRPASCASPLPPRQPRMRVRGRPPGWCPARAVRVHEVALLLRGRTRASCTFVVSPIALISFSAWLLAPTALGARPCSSMTISLRGSSLESLSDESALAGGLLSSSRRDRSAPARTRLASIAEPHPCAPHPEQVALPIRVACPRRSSAPHRTASARSPRSAAQLRCASWKDARKNTPLQEAWYTG